MFNICKVHPNAEYSVPDPKAPLATEPPVLQPWWAESDVATIEGSKSGGVFLGLDTSPTDELNC